MFGWSSLKATLLMALLSLSTVALAKDYKGAEIITHQTFKYGAFEARIRGAKGSGMITAFFLWKNGSELPGTEWQEQDFELFGKDGRYQTQVMTPGDPRTENNVYHTLPVKSYDAYHTYRMEWTPTYLAFYVDGVLVRRETDPVRYAKLLDPARAEPAQLRLSMWAGDFNWSGAFDAAAVPAATYIEFANVYAYTPGTGEGGSNFTPIWKDDFNTIDNSRWWFANWTFEYAVNDYVTANARAIDGKLVLALTTNQNSGQFPAVIPGDNPPTDPVDPETPEQYTPVAVPGRVQAEVVSDYLDTTAANQGTASCSATSVDAQTTTDAGGGCNVGWTIAGEWLEYRIDVTEAGEYDVLTRAATARAGAVFSVELDGVDISGPVTVANNGWQSFSHYAARTYLEAGEHTIRVNIIGSNVNLNYIDVLKVAVTDEPPQPEPPVGVVIPAKIEAEHFDDFFDTTSAQRGNVGCNTGAVDAEFTTDVGGGCNIGWAAPGEWLAYNIQASAGDYDLLLRVATATSGRLVTVEIDGVIVGEDLLVPQSGWQDFFDVVLPVSLTEGEHTVRVFFENGNVNFNYLVFSNSGVSQPPVEPEPEAPVVPEETAPTEPEAPEEQPEEPAPSPEEPAPNPEEPACAAVTLQAEHMVPSTGGASPNGWNLWTNGTLSQSYSFKGGDTLIEVIAHGSLAAGVWPNMNVLVNGVVVGSATVDSATYGSYFFSIDAPIGTANLAVQFTNDYFQNGEDRNLYIDAIKVDECF